MPKALQVFFALVGVSALANHAAAAGSPVAADEAQPWLILPDTPAMPTADMSGLASVNDIEMYYAVFNKGGSDPVILLHGGLGNSDIWSIEIPLLAKTHEVIVADSRGHGRSTRSAQPFSYELMASDVIGLMDCLKVPKASIVGWSDGGIIGLVIAISYRERLNRLVTYGANFSRTGEKTDPADDATRARGARFLARMEASYRTLSPTPDAFMTLRKALGEMYAKEPELRPADLAAITAPTLIVAGEYEEFYTREHFEQLARLIPGGKFVILPSAGHGGPIQRPKEFHEIVATFLSQP